jgi:predicted nucleic acid-binding Zn ribbon protein
MEPLNRLVPGVVQAIVRSAPLSPEKVAFAWRSAAGPAMARVASVQLSGEGTVEVHCPDDQWRREIRRSASVIRDRLRALLGDDVVKQVKVGPRGARHR